MYLFQVFAMMQVGNLPLPLPLPILTTTLHADFPPLHIGIKVITLTLMLLFTILTFIIFRIIKKIYLFLDCPLLQYYLFLQTQNFVKKRHKIETKFHKVFKLKCFSWQHTLQLFKSLNNFMKINQVNFYFNKFFTRFFYKDKSIDPIRNFQCIKKNFSFIKSYCRIVA